MVNNLPVNARDVGSIPGSRRSPGGGNGNPFQYYCLQNPMDKEPGRLQSMGMCVCVFLRYKSVYNL